MLSRKTCKKCHSERYKTNQEVYSFDRFWDMGRIWCPEYETFKSLAKLSVPFDRGLGRARTMFQTLPEIFEVTEIVYSGVGVEDQDDE